MLTAIAASVLFLPLYLLVRSPYLRLPLHIDTGFYVSNDTIANGHLRYARGWNAHFAGCSKVIPEIFYSLVWLIHCRKCGTGGEKFASWSRLYAGFHNYLTALVLGCVAWQVGGGVEYFIAGLVVYGLMSSEPQWGAYYECGELFELPWQIASFGLLYHGMHMGDARFVVAAAFFWAAEAMFIKLSSIIAFVVVFGVAAVFQPAIVFPTVIGAVLAGALYAWWTHANRQRISGLFKGLASHERNFGQTARWSVIRLRLREKLALLAKTIRVQPTIPAMAVVGVLTTPIGGSLWWSYLFGVFLTYAAQATDCWYYQIPLLPPIALAGCFAVVAAASGSQAAALLVFGGVTWLLLNTVRARQLDEKALARWVWNANAPESQLTLNESLEQSASEIAELLHGRSLLVYGPISQAYVLIGAGYSTPIVTPEHYLDDVCPGWQRRLNARMFVAPPGFVLDTGDCFDAIAAREGLGLDYRIVRHFPSRVRLFSLVHRSQSARSIESVHTYRHLAFDDLRIQDAEALDAAAERDNLEPVGALDKASRTDEAARRLAELLRTLKTRGLNRIAVFGAGRFTARHAGVYRAAPVMVAVILDDRAERHGRKYLDWPIQSPADIDSGDFDAVVISTDRFGASMAERAQALFDGVIPVFRADRAVAAQLDDIGSNQTVLQSLI